MVANDIFFRPTKTFPFNLNRNSFDVPLKILAQPHFCKKEGKMLFYFLFMMIENNALPYKNMLRSEKYFLLRPDVILAMILTRFCQFFDVRKN
jgi:hypothetical protein